MPSESFRPEFHQIDEFIFDSAFFNSDINASHSLGQTNLRKIRPSFRDGPFGLFRRINLIVPSRFLRLDLPSIRIQEQLTEISSSCPLIPVMQATDEARRRMTGHLEDARELFERAARLQARSSLQSRIGELKSATGAAEKLTREFQRKRKSS